MHKDIIAPAADDHDRPAASVIGRFTLVPISCLCPAFIILPKTGDAAQ
jgi:hypothetical protein